MVQIPRQQAKLVVEGFGKGDVLRWDKFVFDPQSPKRVKDSYFILLSGRLGNGIFIAIRPTKEFDFYRSRRNLIDTIVLSARESRFFPKQTILDLKQLIPLNVEDIVEKFGSAVKRLGRLEESVMIRLDSAVINAKTLQPDIIQTIITSVAGTTK